jgi:hypothetical protein
MLCLVILMAGLVMLLKLVGSYVYTLKTTKDRVVANSLAQEGLELVLAKRNQNFLTLNDIDLANNKDWLDGLSTQFCINPDLTTFACSSEQAKLYLNPGNNLFYHEQNPDSARPTIFTRTIKIEPVQADSLTSANAVKIIATVQWENSQTKLQTIMTKWHPQAE